MGWGDEPAGSLGSLVCEDEVVVESLRGCSFAILRILCRNSVADV